MYELDEKLGHAGTADGLEGRHDLEVIRRGMDDGEAGRVVTEGEERGSDGGGVIINGKATVGGDG